MEERGSLVQNWPQVFLTRVMASEDLPDAEILTLPHYESRDAIPDLKHLERLLHSGSVEEFALIGGSGIDHSGVDACRAAMHQVIIDAVVRERLPWNPKGAEAYADTIFSSYPVPVMNSPVSGSTLLQIVTAAGGGAAFMAAFPHAELGHITLYFLMIGGTRIVLGAADVIAIGLKQGLSQVILKWMGVPQETANPSKRKKNPA
jgi:hypothetical protein